MNYNKLYEDLVLKARSENRKRSDLEEYEEHHIIPVCMNGSDDKINLVLFTLKEHFIAHKLLVEIYPENIKLFYALTAMMFLKRKDRHYKIGAREFERIKKELADKRRGVPRSEITKERMREYRRKHPFNHTEETKELISVMLTGITRTDEYKQHLSDSRMGMEFSEEHKNNLSLSKLGKDTWNKGLTGIYTEETLTNISEGLKKYYEENPVKEETREKQRLVYKNHPIQTCPHCGYESNNPGVMARAHFENCKLSPNYIPKEKIQCPYCEVNSERVWLMNRHHDENCKHKPVELEYVA